MKISVLYHSVSGNTKHMAEVIVDSMNTVAGVEAKAFSIDAVDEAFVKESRCVVMGCPTYIAGPSAAFYTYMEKEMGKLNLAGKLGGAFSTAQYAHGGGELVIRTILDHMMTMGMLTYSVGGSKGKPVIHMGPEAIATAGNTEMLAQYEDIFRFYGQHMAEKAAELFG